MNLYNDKPIKVPRFEEENGFYTSPERSRLMSKIGAENTKPEQILRKNLWHSGIRYRKNVKNMKGVPDIVITKHKIVVFVDGEFWHGYKWDEKKKNIKSNRAFWIPKIERNIQRDLENNRYYESNGWHVLRFWEHEVKNRLEACLNDVHEIIVECSQKA